MDRPTPTIHTERVSRSDERGPVLLIVVVAVAIALAALKPWQAPAAGDPRAMSPAPIAGLPTRVTLATFTPAPTPAPSPTLSAVEAAALGARDRRQCQSNLGWRVVTMEQSGSRRTRTLLAVDPRSTRDGPGDPRIPTVVLYAERLIGIGYCVPATDGAAVDRARPEVLIWRVGPAGPPVRVVGPVTLDAGLVAAGESYFGPPDGMPALWPPGRYVFEIVPAQPRLPSSFFALEYRTGVTTAGGPGTTPSP